MCTLDCRDCEHAHAAAEAVSDGKLENTDSGSDWEEGQNSER